MKVEILISTMNKKCISELNLSQKNIFENCTIINQITDEKLKLINEEIKERNIKIISYREKGLSKSRNRALENSTGDIIILTDDDISFIEGSLEEIKKEFNRNKNFDILTFKFQKEDFNKNKKYKSKEFIHNYNTIRKVSSVEIAMKRDIIIEKQIKYDEKFGLGAKYNSGEENIFLKDCLDKKLKIKYIPFNIVKHPSESLSTPYYWSEEYIKGKGPLFYRLYGKLGYLLFILLILSKRRRIKNMSLFKSIKFGIKEICNYRRMI